MYRARLMGADIPHSCLNVRVTHQGLHGSWIHSRAQQFSTVGGPEFVQIPDLAFVIVPASLTGSTIETGSVYQSFQSTK